MRSNFGMRHGIRNGFSEAQLGRMNLRRADCDNTVYHVLYGTEPCFLRESMLERMLPLKRVTGVAYD